MASRSMSRPATSSSSSSSGERERKAEGKSSEMTDSLPPEDERRLFPWRQGDAPANQVRCTEMGGAYLRVVT